MRTQIQRCLSLVCLLLLADGCSGDCPSGTNQSGSCDLSNTVADPSMDVKQIAVDPTCDYAPTALCGSEFGFTCSLGGGAQHRQGYVVIADQAGWDKLAASWASDPTPCTPAALPTDWTDTFLVLARVTASSAVESAVQHTTYRRSDGTPHIVLDFDVTFEEGCDCAQQAAIGLVVKSKTHPRVCLKVASSCG